MAARLLRAALSQHQPAAMRGMLRTPLAPLTSQGVWLTSAGASSWLHSASLGGKEGSGERREEGRKDWMAGGSGGSRRGVHHFSSASSTSSSSAADGDEVSLVQGASRGLGFEFVKQLLARGPNSRVVATCRDPAGAQRLQNLKDQSGGRLEVITLDVLQEESIQAAAAEVASRFGRLNLLLNCAGILHVPNEVKPETSMRWLDPEAMLLTYRTNSVGPMLVLKHMAPLLEKGGGEAAGRPAAVVASLSARVGSIEDNKLGGWYSYRASKSALNQYMRTASVELKRKKNPIVTVVIHPGTVDTDLSKPFQRNVPEGKLFTTEYSVQKMMEVIEGLTTNDNGKFYAWDGSEIPF